MGASPLMLADPRTSCMVVGTCALQKCVYMITGMEKLGGQAARGYRASETNYS